MNIFELAAQNQQIAWEILNTNAIIPAWEHIGAIVHVVGSLRSGLMMKNRDIDLHVYTDRLDIEESFSVMQKLAKGMPLKEILYKNGIDSEEECIEWHALYDDKNMNEWKFDIIHIRRGSRYDGVVERVTEAITHQLTPELRQTILQIKYEIPDGILIPGIEVYHAVFAGNVKNYGELEHWRKTNPLTNSLDWFP